MRKEQERLEVNIYAIETHLNSLLAEKQELLDDIKQGYFVRKNYMKDISTAQSNNQENLKVKLEGVNEGIEYLNGKLNEINKKLDIAEEKYSEANTEYAEYIYLQKGSGIKRKIVKRKVIPVKPTVSKPAKPTVSKPAKPTARKPTKPTARKPTKRPTKPTARKPTIVRRK